MQVAYEVLRTTTDITEHADRPKCIGCGFTDGCVDDIFGGSVDTIWTDSPYGMICRSCTNMALWNAYGKRRAIELHPVCPVCKLENSDAHYDIEHDICPIYENAWADSETSGHRDFRRAA